MIPRRYYWDGEKEVSRIDWEEVRYRGWCLFVILVILYFVSACSVHLVAVQDPRVKVQFTTEQYLDELGLDVSQTYNLELGSPSGGSVGDIDTSLSVNFFLFAGTTTSATTGQITPASAVRLGFRTQEISYILEIPYSKVQFNPQEGVQSSVKFIVNNFYEDFKQRFVEDANFWTFQMGHLEERQPTVRDTLLWSEVQAEGLPTFLNKRLSRVEFTLTPAQYKAYLGTLQPTG